MSTRQRAFVIPQARRHFSGMQGQPAGTGVPTRTRSSGLPVGAEVYALCRACTTSRCFVHEPVHSITIDARVLRCGRN